MYWESLYLSLRYIDDFKNALILSFDEFIKYTLFSRTAALAMMVRTLVL